MMERQEFQDVSEISIFNAIGECAESKGLHPIYFKSAMPVLKLKDDFTTNGFDFKFMHYIHIIKDEKMKISIYYDDSDIGAMMGQPYYEIYYGGEIERFLETKDEEEALFKMAEGLM